MGGPYMTRLPRRVREVLVLAAVLALTGCTSGAASTANPTAAPASPTGAPAATVAGTTSGSAVERIKTAGVIRMGYSNEFPFAFSEGEKLTGEAPEMMKAFAASIGVEHVDGVLIEWAGLIPALQANRIDAIAAGMAIVPERCKQVTFSEPEVIYHGSLIVKKGNPKGIMSWRSFAEQPATKLGVVSGSADADYWQFNNMKEDQVLKFPDQPTLLAAVQGGRIDGGWVDTLTAFNLVEKSGDANLEVVVPALADLPLNENGKAVAAYGAVVWRQADADLRDAFTAWLQGAKKDGTLKGIMEPFGFGEEQIAPLGTKAEDLCKG